MSNNDDFINEEPENDSYPSTEKAPKTKGKKGKRKSRRNARRNRTKEAHLDNDDWS